MLMYRSAVPTFTLLLSLAGAALGALPSGAADKPAPAKPAPTKPATAELYRLRPGDEVSISVTPQKDYDCGGVILPDGRIYLKTVGPIKAVGLSIPELEELLRKKLDEDLVEPQIRVALVHIAPDPVEKPVEPVKPGKITLVGAIGKSGPMELEPGLRLRKALDLAGGAGKDADLSRVSIIHPDLTRTIVDISSPERVLNPKHNLLLQDGDSVEVPLLPPAPATVANPVRISGQVLNPGQFELKQGMTAEDLIITAGRITPLADLEHIELRRTGKPAVIINLLAQQTQGAGSSVALEPADEIFVPQVKGTVLVLGAVTGGGAHPLKPGATIRDFFLDPSMAASISPGSQKLEGVRVMRNGQKEPYKVDLEEVLKKPSRKDNVTLQVGDVVYIPPRETNQRNGILDQVSRLGPLAWLLGIF